MVAAIVCCQLGNVLIMERCANNTKRQWHLRTVVRFDWLKLELAAKIDDEDPLKMPLAPQKEVCYTEAQRGCG